MEADGELLAARPALESDGLRFLHASVGSLLAAYGWYLVGACVLLYALAQKLSPRLRALRQTRLERAAAADVEPDTVVKRQEALAAARLRMQEELNLQVEKHKEKLKQLEEEKRRQKIAQWDNMQEGRSRKAASQQQEQQEADHQHPQAPRNGGQTGSLCGAGVTTHCRVKAGAPVPGDRDVGAQPQGDEAKGPVGISWDASRSPPLLLLSTHCSQ